MGEGGWNMLLVWRTGHRGLYTRPLSPPPSTTVYRSASWTGTEVSSRVWMAAHTAEPPQPPKYSPLSWSKSCSRGHLSGKPDRWLCQGSKAKDVSVSLDFDL